MQHRFRKTAKITLILVYLVIIAGAVVRMTGSGMGCPDWPKCFGYLIPPTEEAELLWTANKEFKRGQVIIVDETLKIAARDFSTSSTYQPENWNTYQKHDYAVFNVWHTWIEYINRLFGALAGLATLVLAFFSLRYWKKQKAITLLSVLIVLGMGFQAWLGATVVYSVLAPAKITIHMLMALVLVLMLIYVIYATKEKSVTQSADSFTKNLVLFSIILTLIQVALGTQVRQFIDEQVDTLGALNKGAWLQAPTLVFYVHRSLSILVVVVNSILVYRIFKKNLGFSKINWVIVLIGIEILSGVVMYYFDFPFATQPIHLVIASLLFGVQSYLLLEVVNANKTLKTL